MIRFVPTFERMTFVSTRGRVCQTGVTTIATLPPTLDTELQGRQRGEGADHGSFPIFDQFVIRIGFPESLSFPMIRE